MIRLVTYSVFGVFLAVQIYLFSSFSILSGIIRDNPKMSLPVAERTKLVHYEISENISWTQKGGWVVAGKGPIKDRDIDSFLRDMVEQSKSEGLVPRLRIRIPADASPRVFVNLTRRMQDAGVQEFCLAVIER